MISQVTIHRNLRWNIKISTKKSSPSTVRRYWFPIKEKTPPISIKNVFIFWSTPCSNCFSEWDSYKSKKSKTYSSLREDNSSRFATFGKVLLKFDWVFLELSNVLASIWWLRTLFYPLKVFHQVYFALLTAFFKDSIALFFEATER